jgi:phospholipase C
MRLTGLCVTGLVGTGLILAAACSSNSNSSQPADAGKSADAGPPVEDDAGDSGLPTPAAWNATYTQPSDTAAAAGRSSCTYERGAMPIQTLGPSTPLDVNIPIDTVVVVMMENRSFDSMLGHMNEVYHRTDVNEPPVNASNPSVPAGLLAGGGQDAGGDDGGAADGGDAGGGEDAGSGGGTGAGPTYPWTHATAECFADTDHSWRGQHVAWDNGLNDGFYYQNIGSSDENSFPNQPDGAPSPLLSGERAMWFYDNTDIPFEYSLAESFAFADNYHCSVLGPTEPNRVYLMASTSFGVTDSTIPGISETTTVVDNAVITDELEQRHTSWAVYSDGTPSLVAALSIGVVSRYGRTVRFSNQDFLDAAAAGTIPSVAYVDPSVGIDDGQPTNNDQHPPSDVQIGSAWLESIVKAVMASPQWPHTALFITWDENGGEYDHAPPPAACAPDSIAPMLYGSDVGTVGTFAQYGFRVPLIVVSPYAKRGYVSHNLYDHTSIARFIEAKFKIPALTARDANADPLMDLFDFTAAPNTTAPTLTPPIEDDAGLAYCISNY